MAIFQINMNTYLDTEKKKVFSVPTFKQPPANEGSVFGKKNAHLFEATGREEPHDSMMQFDSSTGYYCTKSVEYRHIESGATFWDVCRQ